MLTARSALLAAGQAALTLTLGACGHGGSDAPSNPPAPPLSARAPDEVPVTAAQLRAPIARYRRWVATRLRATSATVAALRARLVAGDLAVARAQWARATRAYGAIGAAYGAFGHYDSAIRLGRMAIDPAEYVLRAHEVLEDALAFDLTGRSDYSRGTDAAGQLDQGLVFASYKRDIAKQFEAVQQRLVDEPLVDYVVPTGGRYAFLPPGAVGADDWVGSGLFA